MAQTLLITLVMMFRIGELRQEHVEAAFARQQSESLKTLLRIISHDLLTPLSIAIGSAKRGLASQSHGTTPPGTWERIINAMERQRKILEHVRHLRMLEDGKRPLTLSSVRVDAILNEAVDHAESQLNAKNSRLVMQCDLPAGTCLLADETSACHQVLGNVLNNAIKFSQPGSVITITTQESPATVTIAVSDCGIGMPRHLLDVLFDLEQPTSRPGTNGEPGTGYGMPLVKSYMNKFGGRIEVESRPIDRFPAESGTTVRLVFQKASPTSR